MKFSRFSILRPLREVPGIESGVVIEHHGSASIGVVLFWGNEETLEQLQAKADEAMFLVKARGQRRVFPGWRAMARRRRGLRAVAHWPIVATAFGIKEKGGMIKAIWLEQEDKITKASLREISEDALDAGDTTVRIECLR